ncbi:DUF6207 family protein [Streptomyces sp. NBC_00299]|uniref:DUF6207 family protein n=1 Tax=Streptomyces sp. NBC_00299 TaxID=2975705 RepID=UPI003FA7E0DB
MRPRSPSSSCSPNGGQRRQRNARRGMRGEPGVRLRCYLDLRQPISPAASDEALPLVSAAASP